MPEEVSGKLIFEVPGTNRKVTHQPGPGIFEVVDENEMTFLTHPCVRGITGCAATIFEADDGRTARIEWVDVMNKRTRFLLLTELAKPTN